MRHRTRWSIIFAVLGFSVVSFGVFTSHAAWVNFGGSNTFGRLWSWDMPDVCLDAVRVGFATDRYYYPTDEEPDKDVAVYAYLSIYEEDPILVPHKVHPPRQPAPVLVGGVSERDFHTMLNIPFITPYSSPISLDNFTMFTYGTESGGLNFNGENWTMEDCYLRKGVVNGGFETALRPVKTLPFGWDTSKLGQGDQLMCDRVKHETLPDKFYSFEAGVVNTASHDIDPDTNPGCAFRFLGKPDKISSLSQKNKNVSDFEDGDTLTIVAYAYGKDTAKSNVQIKVQVKYPGAGNQQIITATTQPEDKINQAYIRYVGSVELTGIPNFVKTTIRFDDPNGTLFVDGVYMRLDKDELTLTSQDSSKPGWLTLPEVQQ